MHAEHRAEAVDERPGCQAVSRSDPFVRIGDGTEINGQECADRTETEQHRASTELGHELQNAARRGLLRRCALPHSIAHDRRQQFIDVADPTVEWVTALQHMRTTRGDGDEFG
jgi:hypothetical protein